MLGTKFFDEDRSRDPGCRTKKRHKSWRDLAERRELSARAAFLVGGGSINQTRLEKNEKKTAIGPFYPSRETEIYPYPSASSCIITFRLKRDLTSSHQTTFQKRDLRHARETASAPQSTAASAAEIQETFPMPRPEITLGFQFLQSIFTLKAPFSEKISRRSARNPL